MKTNPSLNTNAVIHMFFGFLLLLTVPLSAQADATNDCKNPDATIQWEQLAKKYPDDMAIHRLHALRLGLCEKVERGDVTVEHDTQRCDGPSASFTRKPSNRSKQPFVRP